jgi:acyl-CoA synthetase (AMP-forming)/AMP-acid ligase II
MHASFSYLAAMLACTLCAMVATTVSAQSAKYIRGPSALVAIENEEPAKIVVDPPLAEQLAKGLVFIQYRAENLRVVPVFGKGALTVSPRIGHVHITVDDNSWHFVDASGETVILVGLKPGAHSVLFELADPTHKVITSQTVKFVVPDTKGAGHG